MPDIDCWGWGGVCGVVFWGREGEIGFRGGTKDSDGGWSLARRALMVCVKTTTSLLDSVLSGLAQIGLATANKHPELDALSVYTRSTVTYSHSAVVYDATSGPLLEHDRGLARHGPERQS